MRARREHFENFKEAFKVSNWADGFGIEVTNHEGGRDLIKVYVYPKTPHIERVNLDSPEPILFAPSHLAVTFRRFSLDAPKSDKALEKDEGGPYFDFEDDDEGWEDEDSKDPKPQDTEEKMQADILRELETRGVHNVHLIPYLLRMARESQNYETAIARNKAELIMPTYRSLETQRLLADPTKEDSNYYAIAKRRQNVYSQLLATLKEAEYSPEKITKYMLEGLFDADHIAGVPVFTDENFNHYVVIDYKYAGYNETAPQEPGFSDRYQHRGTVEITQIIDAAEKAGYMTYHCKEGVSGGTHQSYDWHGIRIEDFDTTNQEANTQKVIRILEDLSINPLEATHNMDGDNFDDRYMITH